MQRPAPQAIFHSPPRHDPERDVLALSERTLRMIRVAHALAQSERTVDLQGLQRQVGLLCAKALDLPPEQAGFARLELHRLVQGIDALEQTMRNQPA
jgi:hypothetical protein